MRLSDVAITKRILIAVSLPILLVAWLAYDRFDRDLSTYREAAHLVEVADSISAIGDTIHRLQVERGESAAALGGKSEGLPDSMKQARLSADGGASALLDPAAGDMHAEVSVLRDTLGQLQGFRKKVDERSVSADESSAFYASIIGRLLAVPRSLAEQASNRELSNEIASYNRLSEAKELAGLERATGNAVISSRVLDESRSLRLAHLYGAQTALLTGFRDGYPALSKEIQAILPDAGGALATMRRALLSGGAGLDLSDWNTRDWHAAATDRINALGDIEKQVLASLHGHAVRVAEQELNALIGVGLGLSASVAIAVLLSIFIGLGVVRPLRKLTAAIEKLANGDMDEGSVAVTSRDEIGAMAAAVRGAIAAAGKRADLEHQEDLRRAAEKQAEMQIAEQEREARASELEWALSELDRGLTELAGGNLNYRIAVELAADLDPLRLAYNTSAETLKGLVALAGRTASFITTGCGELGDAADDLARRTAGQAAALEQAAAALEEVTTAVKMSARGAEEAKKSVTVADCDAGQAAGIVADTVAAMQAIARSSEQIGHIIGVIDEIAFQTNLLALNAGVEAARAGEAGKGFAVVAQEVRELAQRSAVAAREIKELVATASRDVSGGVTLVGKTGEALDGIERHVRVINEQVSAIVQSSREQSEALAEITSTIGQLDQITQQNASMVEQTNASTQSLAVEAERLKSQFGAFRAGEGKGKALGGCPLAA